jgi:hypothetical protein
MSSKRNPLAGVDLAEKVKAWKETDLTKSPQERSKAAKHARRADDTERIQIEVTEGVGALLDKIATELHTTRSAVAEYLLLEGARNGDPAELRQRLTPARSPRYEFKLIRSSLDQWRTAFTSRWLELGKKDAE